MVQRDAERQDARARETVANTQPRTLMPRVLDNVAAGSTVYTERCVHVSVARDRGAIEHLVIDHAVRYVKGHVHDEPH